MLSSYRLVKNRSNFLYRIFCVESFDNQSILYNNNRYRSIEQCPTIKSSPYICDYQRNCFNPLFDISKTFSTINDPKNGFDYLSGTIASQLVDRLPDEVRPYARLMRLDKPTGTWLLLLPCWWSIGLSTTAGSLPSLSLMTLFGIGAVLMRSAGCIVNDIWDRRFDRNVERTRFRPLASEQIQLNEAIALLATLLGSSLLVLIQFDLNR